MILRQRPRRNRKSHSIRDLVQESRLSTDDLIMPLFIKEKKGSENIQSMPGQKRLDRDDLFRECESLLNLGVKGVSLFPAIEENLKDSKATESHNPTGLYPETIRALKERFPDLVLMTDVAMDPYSSDGHDGLVDDSPAAACIPSQCHPVHAASRYGHFCFLAAEHRSSPEYILPQ